MGTHMHSANSHGNKSSFSYLIHGACYHNFVHISTQKPNKWLSSMMGGKRVLGFKKSLY